MIGQILAHEFGDQSKSQTKVRKQIGSETKVRGDLVCRGGDIEKSNDKLKFALCSIRFPHTYLEDM